MHIHERFFRHIWCNQYLRTGALKTVDGRPVRVSRPGVLNAFGGPDVQDAVVTIGGITFAGDIEIHRTAGDWAQHRHDTNPAYNKVILHVVLENSSPLVPTTTASGRSVPVLVLGPFLKEPLPSLLRQITADETLRVSGDIPCRYRNESVEAPVLHSWITRLARERLEMKIQRFDARLRELAASGDQSLREPWRHYRRPRLEGFPEEIPPPGPIASTAALSNRRVWDQVLYEGLMDGLGYSRNRQSFLRLAQIASLDRMRELNISEDSFQILSLLFGISGLLPSMRSLRTAAARTYVRKLRSTWRRIRTNLRCERLHPADWHFFPTRPGNFPTIRIASAASMAERILTGDLFRRIIRTFKEPLPHNVRTVLRSLLSVDHDSFWSGHFHFDRQRPREGILIGTSRLDDLIANTVLPLSLLYARIFHDREVREQAEQLYHEYPPLSSNSILRTMERQLLTGRTNLDRMHLQQGVIQLYGSYCKLKRCGECEIGKVVFGQTLRSSAASSLRRGTRRYSG